MLRLDAVEAVHVDSMLNRTIAIKIPSLTLTACYFLTVIDELGDETVQVRVLGE